MDGMILLASDIVLKGRAQEGGGSNVMGLSPCTFFPCIAIPPHSSHPSSVPITCAVTCIDATLYIPSGLGELIATPRQSR